MYLNYVILPVGNMGLSTYFTLNPNYDLKIKPLESWVIFFTVVCFSRVFEFFSSIKKIVLDDARIFLQTRKVLLEGQLDDLIQENDAIENKTGDANFTKKAILLLTQDSKNYMKRIRTYGEGEIRINQAIYLHDDIYSIGFVSQLRDDIMKKYLNISTGKLVQDEEPEEEVEEEVISEEEKTVRNDKA